MKQVNGSLLIALCAFFACCCAKRDDTPQFQKELGAIMDNYSSKDIKVREKAFIEGIELCKRAKFKNVHWDLNYLLGITAAKYSLLLKEEMRSEEARSMMSAALLYFRDSRYSEQFKSEEDVLRFLVTD